MFKGQNSNQLQEKNKVAENHKKELTVIPMQWQPSCKNQHVVIIIERLEIIIERLS